MFCVSVEHLYQHTSA